MATTIQISDEVKTTLEEMKIIERETYNDVIERMIEDNMELNEKTKKELSEAKKRVSSGKFITQKEVEEKLGL